MAASPASSAPPPEELTPLPLDEPPLVDPFELPEPLELLEPLAPPDPLEPLEDPPVDVPPSATDAGDRDPHAVRARRTNAVLRVMATSRAHHSEAREVCLPIGRYMLDGPVILAS